MLHWASVGLFTGMFENAFWERWVCYISLLTISLSLFPTPLDSLLWPLTLTPSVHAFLNTVTTCCSCLNQIRILGSCSVSMGELFTKNIAFTHIECEISFQKKQHEQPEQLKISSFLNAHSKLASQIKKIKTDIS